MAETYTTVTGEEMALPPRLVADRATARLIHDLADINAEYDALTEQLDRLQARRRQLAARRRSLRSTVSHINAFRNEA